LYAEGKNEKNMLVFFNEYQEVQIANVTPGENNSVYFLCKIDGAYFKDKNITKIKCSLGAVIEPNWERINAKDQKIDRNWSIEVIPDVIELEPVEQKEFFVIVNVPSGMSYWAFGNVTVFGTVETLPDNNKYEINNISGIVRIKQYSDWNISSLKTSQSINKGDTTIFKVNVTNSGNGVEPFAFEFDSDKLKWFSEKGFNIQSETYHINIDEKQSKEVKITVKTSKETPPGDYEIDLRIGNHESIELSQIENHSKHIIFLLNVKPDFVDKYFFLSTIIVIIFVIIICVKIISIKKRSKN
jgi:hypothetical protein